MSEFRKGDWVECVEDKDCDLAKGSSYLVTLVLSSAIQVKDDAEDLWAYPKRLFKPAGQATGESK